MSQVDSTPVSGDSDPAETAEWLESLQYALETKGPERVAYLMSKLSVAAHRHGVDLPFSATTPYINTIPVDKQPVFPGNREIERRIKSIIRWNAMAMVVRANKVGPDGPGGHISTFASSATLYEIGYNHFFRGKGDGYDGDQVYFQGHASPGMYSRAFVEGRLSEAQLVNFRHELAPGGGLSSYPHPWLMPEFWEFPTVSMGLGPINSIYQARFNKYLADRGLKDTTNQKVWAFLGDGECDEPESLGAITLASREKLDNLIFVINCNLQRLDGPVRGNGKIIQELEGAFRGAGWNVIKVVWGDDWDALLEKDHSGALVERMGEVVDGEYQKYVVSGGAYIREHFFGKSPELLEMVSHMSDEKINSMRRGGHDPEKVYAAYKWAAENKNGKPTVILAKTIKGYGLGEAGEGRNVAHNQKKVNENELIQFRSRFGIPISDEDVVKAPFYKPAEDSPEMKYLRERREALGGPVPIRSKERPKSIIPPNSNFADSFTSSDDREVSTTMAFVKQFARLLKDKNIGKYIVPIVPDESRTFGMDPLFSQCGIYAHAGQLYEPVDSDNFLYYKEAKDGQILEEGITEAGSMASFIAAGSSYVTHGINMIPFFVYYSMFGFQRIGDSIWLAQDMKCKGFLMGGTAGRTTLNGEGLQHQDGHSHLIASSFPGIRCYDPAYAYEIATIVLDGMREMYERDQEVMYYITLHNENYKMPAMPAGVEEGIIKGMYKVSSVDAGSGAPKVVLFGSGAILRCALDSQKLLAEKYGVSSNVYSVTSYKTLWTEANDCEHWNLLHPSETPKKSYVEKLLADETGPFISTSDNVRLVAQQIEPWVPGDYYVLGCDGVGRSDRRARLRRHFEVDAECTTLAALTRLAKQGKFDAAKLPQVIKDLGIDPEKGNPVSI